MTSPFCSGNGWLHVALDSRGRICVPTFFRIGSDSFRITKALLMKMKHILLSGILLPALIVISFALNQGLIQAVVGDGDVSLTVDSGTLPNGQIVELTGTLDFATDNISYIHRVALVVDGPDGQDLDVVLPLEEVTALDLTGAPGVTGESLEVTVDFDGVVESGGTLPGSTIPGESFGGGTLPGGTLPDNSCSGGTLPGTLPGGTIPGGTLPGGNGFIGIGDGGTITYSIDWNPALVGSYQGHLEVVTSGVNGCTLVRSDMVEFSVTVAPPYPEDPDNSKVTLCHVPRGNPAAAHVITVGAPAVAAHLRHGDSISTTCQPSGDIDLDTEPHDDSDDDNHFDDDIDVAKKGHGKPSHDGKGKKADKKDDDKHHGPSVSDKPGDKGNKGKKHDDDRAKKSSKKSHGKPSDDGKGKKADKKDDDKHHGPTAKAKPGDKANKDKKHDDDRGKKSPKKSHGKHSDDGKDKKADKKDDDKRHGSSAKAKPDDKAKGKVKKVDKSDKAKGY